MNIYFQIKMGELRKEVKKYLSSKLTEEEIKKENWVNKFIEKCKEYLDDCLAVDIDGDYVYIVLSQYRRKQETNIPTIEELFQNEIETIFVTESAFKTDFDKEITEYIKAYQEYEN